MNDGHGADLQKRLTGLFDDLKEERTLAARRRRHDELTEAIRQLELAVLKLESEEKARLMALEDKLQSKRQIAAMISDYERERRTCNRQVARLKKLRQKLKGITEEGIDARASIRVLEGEIAWWQETQNLSVSPEVVSGRVRDLEARIARLKESLESLRSAYREVELEIENLAPVERELWKIDRSIGLSKKAKMECEDLTDEIERTKSHFSRQYHVRREIAAIADLQKQIKANNYEPDKHERLLHRIYNFLEAELGVLLGLTAEKSES